MTKWICNECKSIGQVCKCENTKYSPFFCVVHKVKQADWRIDNTDLNTATIESVETETTLPDWCKVGAWIYNHTEKKEYAKITKIDPGVIYLDCFSYTAIGEDVLAKEYVQARLRPWMPEEAVGKVVYVSKGCYLITSADEFMSKVGSEFIRLDRLADRYFQPDGSPCGKLEHLEDGEWVE